MTTLREAAQQALEYMKSVGKMDMHPEEWAIVGRLEAALAKPVQEPVAFKDAPERIWLQACEDDHCEVPFREHDEITWCAEQQNPLDVPYVRADLAAPPQRPAEPVPEPDSPERRCGGPGCDMTCCQPVQEPQCNPHPEAPHGFLRNASHTEGRYVCECEYWSEPVQEPVACRYPDCVDNGPEGKCVRWLVGECEGPKIGVQP